MSSTAQSTTRLWRFHGGLHLDGHKGVSAGGDVEPAPLPARLVLPLQQHIGAAAKAVVEPGVRVLKGQVLARSEGYVSATVHAPTSGTVSAIEERPVAHPSGLTAPCIVLESDGEECWAELPPPLPDYQAVEPATLRRRVRECGLVGLGGAAFPSAVKLNPGPNHRVRLLILNGAECEPYITCDDMLMRTRARQIIGGLHIMRHLLQVAQAIVGVEDNKPEAAAALAEALAENPAPGVRVTSVPTVYPTGGEKQLIRVLTGREVPSHGIPAEIGVVCHNVGTAAAVHDAVMLGRPLISRYLTVTGDAVARPRVLEVLVGTPVAHLVAHCGGYLDTVARLVMGGPMMGFALHDDEVPVTKGSNCILALSGASLPADGPAMPCIRCGACVDACPAHLLPQQLYWHARAQAFDRTQDYHLFDCIECGCCAAVCPSRIPLVQYYRFAKTEIWAQERERRDADVARQRHEARQRRLEREQQERAARLGEKKKAIRAATDDGATAKKATIEAALARARARKSAGTDGRTDEAAADDAEG